MELATVFPAYAGVILADSYVVDKNCSLSRVCGGDPNVYESDVRRC